MHEVPGDGNCFFHAVVQAAKANSSNTFAEIKEFNNGAQLRKDLQSKINSEACRQKLQNDSVSADLRRELENMIYNNEYGGQSALILLQCAYNEDIKINFVQDLRDGTYTCLACEYDSPDVIWLLFKPSEQSELLNHYEWLEPQQTMEASGVELKAEELDGLKYNLEDLKRLFKTDEEEILNKIKKELERFDDDADLKTKYLQQVVDNLLFNKGNSGIVPFLCRAYSENAVSKFITSMKAYLEFGLRMARQGETQDFYAENYKDFFDLNWKSGVKRFNEYSRYKFFMTDRSLQIDQDILKTALENKQAVNAEHDLISLESPSSFSNWSSIVRFAIYEKYNFFLPNVHDELQGEVYEALVEREGFDDFVYIYCTLYTLIFNTTPIVTEETKVDFEDETKEDSDDETKKDS